jgi:hypothetical protein
MAFRRMAVAHPVRHPDPHPRVFPNAFFVAAFYAVRERYCLDHTLVYDR